MSLKLFHIADLHLGAEVSYLGPKAEARRFELGSVFKKTADFCKNNSVEICLIAGDLFDSNRAAAEFAPSVFEYIKTAPSVKFFYVAGNHDPLDAASPMTSKNLPENLYVFKTDYEIKEFPEQGFRVIGKSFSHSSMTAEDFSRVLPDDGLINIMLLHADISSDKNSPYNPITRDFIENSRVHYLALGHIHMRTSPAKFGDTTFAYSGSPEGHGFDEEGVRGGYLVNLSKDSCEHSFVKLCRRIHRIEKIDVSKAISSVTAANIILEKLSNNYGEAFEEDLYKIIMTGSLEQSVSLKLPEILQILSDRLYFVKLKDMTKKAYDLDSLKNEKNLKGIFVKKMLERISLAEENEKPMLISAMHLGLSAFDSEVTVFED